MDSNKSNMFPNKDHQIRLSFFFFFCVLVTEPPICWEKLYLKIKALFTLNKKINPFLNIVLFS